LKAPFSKLILVYLPTLFVVFGLSFSTPGCVFCDTSQEDQVMEDAEDCDHWVHIRNVSIYDYATNGLQRDMFVLVTCTYIHKIGQIPLFIIDKDVTYTINGEGRIMLPIPAEKQLSDDSENSGEIEEEVPANLIIVDAESLEDLQKLKDQSALQENQSLHEIEEIRLLMENGEIIKNTLPGTRVARIGLRKYVEPEKK
jgi:hypothetical protein